jgi:hypothetical protein
MTEWETTQDRVEMIHKAAREQNFLDSMEYGEKIGHAQYLDRKDATDMMWSGVESFEPTPLNTMFGFDSEGKSVVFGGHSGENIWAKHIVLDKSGTPLNLDRKPTDRRSNIERIIDLSNELGVCMAGYMQRRSTDETRLYNAGGLPVELTLPKGEHEKDPCFQNKLINLVMK